MKSFGELGHAATAGGALDRKTKELIALALSVAARCDPCIGVHMQTLVKLGVTRQEVDETLGASTCMGGGPSPHHSAAEGRAVRTCRRREALAELASR